MGTYLMDVGEIQAFSTSFATTVYGNTGTETLKLLDGTTGTVSFVGSSVERVEFARASTAYNYLATTTGLDVYYGATKIAQLANSQKLAFTDGSTSISATVDTNGVVTMSLGGKVVGASLVTGATLVPTMSTAAGEASTVPTPDTTPPVFASAAVNGSSLVMTYTEATTLDAIHKAAVTDFSVLVGGVANAVTAVAVNATAKTVTLTLTTAVTSGAVVTVGYTDPTSGNDVNAIQDAAGNDAASLTAQAVTNSTPAPVVGKIVDGYIKGATVFADANGDGVWNEGESKTTTDDKGNFTFTGAKGAVISSGGTDISTGKEFKGILKAPEGSTVVTPLTTMQQAFVEKGMTVDNAETAVAKALGFNASSFKVPGNK